MYRLAQTREQPREHLAMSNSLAHKPRLTLLKQEAPAPLPPIESIIPQQQRQERPSSPTPHCWFQLETETRRWLSSLIIVLLGFSLPLLWWLLPDTNPGIAATPPPAAMVVELAPAPVAPVSQPDLPPGPEQSEAAPPPKPEIKPEPEPDPEIPPAPPAPREVRPEVAAAAKVEPKQEEPTPKAEPLPDQIPEEPLSPSEEPPSIASAPPEAQQEDIKTAAPRRGVSAPAANAMTIPNWQNQLMLKLNEAKRYPLKARRYRHEGVSYLRFTMDRAGNVLAKSIEQSAGYPLLDKETLELIDRAQPLPQPPAEMAGETLEFVVPVEFFLNR